MNKSFGLLRTSSTIVLHRQNWKLIVVGRRVTSLVIMLVDAIFFYKFNAEAIMKRSGRNLSRAGYNRREILVRRVEEVRK